MSKTATTSNTTYRLIVGEVGNEQGHVIACGSKTLEGARRALKRAMAGYRGDGWGIIEDAQTGERIERA